MTVVRRSAFHLAVMWALTCSAPLFAQPYLILCDSGFDFDDDGTFCFTPTEFIQVDLSDFNQVQDLLADESTSYVARFCDVAVLYGPGNIWICSQEFSGASNGAGYFIRDGFNYPTYNFTPTCSENWEEQETTNYLLCPGTVADASHESICEAAAGEWETDHCEYEPGIGPPDPGGGSYTGPTAEEFQQAITDGFTFTTYALALLSFLAGWIVGTRQ